MNDEDREKDDLLCELAELRARVAELEDDAHARAEGAPSEAEVRYKALFDSDFFSVYLYDLQGNFLDANDAALKWLGYTREEIPSLSFASLLAPDQLPSVFRDLQEIVETGSQSTPRAYRLKAKSGDLVWIETADRLIYRDGKPYAVLGVARDITESKRAAEELAYRERRFRDIADNALEWIWEVDQNGKYTYSSPAVERILGYPPEEVLQKHFFEFFDPEEGEASKKAAFEVFSRREPFREFENRNLHKNGDLVWLSTSGVPMLDDQGNLLGYRGVDSDITERKRAEEELRRSECILRVVTAASERFLRPSGPSEEDIQDLLKHLGEAAEVSRAYLFANHVGGDGALLTTQCFEWVAAHIASQMDNPELRCFPWRAGGMGRWEEKLSRREVIKGNVKDFPASEQEILVPQDIQSILAVPIHVGKEWLGFMGFDDCESEREWPAREVESLRAASAILGAAFERAEAEAALRESEYQYRLLADNATDVIWVRDMNLVPSYISPSVRKLRGFSVEEAIAQTADESMTPASAELARKTLAEELATESAGPVDPSRSRTIEVEMKCKDDSTIWTEVTVSFLRDENDEAIGILGITRDISERKRAEEEKLVMEEQLRHAQKMEAIGALASGIAHDFNNLLTPILSCANTLKLEAQPGDDVFDASDLIEKAAIRASELTEQLLGFAQKGKHRSAAVDIHRVISDVIELLSRSVDKRIGISQRAKASRPLVTGDPGQIQQVLMNLAINASDAIPDGGEIIFETRTVDLDREHCQAVLEVPRGRYNVVSVTDTGVGIPEDVRDRVFEPFFTTKFTTKDRNKRSGMGLAMAYGIVKNHGGGIRIDSQVGVGTTVEVYLPVGEENAISRNAPQERTPVRGSGTILFVDDEELVCKAVATLLTSLGYVVTSLHNGKEAVDYYREHREEVDLVILDIDMPVMGGGDCFRALKEIDPDVRALLSSGYASDEAAQRLLDEGMLGFLQKPYRLVQLAEAVSRALGR